MNCKQGDMAYIVNSVAGNDGMIVKCVRFLGHVDGCFLEHSTDYWLLDQEINRVLVTPDGHITARLAPAPYISDSFLRPLRGDLLDDEETHSAPADIAVTV